MNTGRVAADRGVGSVGALLTNQSNTERTIVCLFVQLKHDPALVPAARRPRTALPAPCRSGRVGRLPVRKRAGMRSYRVTRPWWRWLS